MIANTQTYYITSACEPSLRPALNLHPRLARPVQDFIAAEQGHHFLVLDSLRALGRRKPADSDYLPETRLMMKLLSFCAADHALAFCCLVGAFEGDDHADADPLAELLGKSSRPRSAQGIQNHFLINQQGNHAAMGEKFVRELGPVTRDCVEASARLVELLCRCQISLSSKLFALASEDT